VSEGSIRGRVLTLAFRIYDGIAPTHFLGELTKTPEGCALLRQRGIIAELAEVLRLHGMEAGDQAIITSVKSALWALVSGHEPSSSPTPPYTHLLQSRSGSDGGPLLTLALRATSGRRRVACPSSRTKRSWKSSLRLPSNPRS
jgi:hypothetical protein